MPYATSNDLELQFGRENLNRWADLDNDKNPNTINARIEWALEEAEEYLNARFVNSKYDVPFGATPPKLIKHLTCLYAGVLLYDGRGQVKTDSAKDQVVNQRGRFNRLIRQILSGQVTLLDGLSGDPLEFNSETTPFAEPIEDISDECSSETCDCESIVYEGQS